MGDYETAYEEERSDNAEAVAKDGSPQPKKAKSRKELEASKGDYAGASRERYKSSFQKQWNETREDAPAHKEGDPFGGGHGKQYKVYGKSAGEGGFGARLLQGSAAVVDVKSKGWAAIASPVTPTLEPLLSAREEQVAFFGSHNKSEGAFGDPNWVREQKDYAQAWAGENISAIERYLFDQSSAVTGFNSWVPLANQSHRAMAEMVETAGLLGFDTKKDLDSAAFIIGVEQALDMATSLVDAPLLGTDKKTSLSRRMDDASATSKTVPQLQGTEVEPSLPAITAAYRELREAHTGVYQSMLEDRKATYDAKAGAAQAQIDQINTMISFWVGTTETIQSAVGGAKAIGKKIDKVVGHQANGDNHARRELGAAKTAAQKQQSDGTDYSSRLAVHSHGGNYEEHYDSWGKGGEESVKKGREAQFEGDIHVAGTGPAAAPLVIPDAPPEISVAGFVRFGLELMEKGKVDALKKTVSELKVQSSAAAQEIQLIRTESAIARFDGASRKFEEESAKAGSSKLRKREQDMMSMGHDLDAYALEHGDALKRQGKSSLVPKDHHEIYATAMAVVAKIEKYRVISQLALATFPYNAFVATATKDARERARQVPVPESPTRKNHHATYPPPELPPMTEQESQLVQQIAGSYLVVLEYDSTWSVRLAEVSKKMAALMVKLTGSGGVPGTVGKAF